LKVKFSSYQTSFGVGFLLLGLLLVSLACHPQAEPPLIDLPANPSPLLTEVITATPSSTLIPAPSPGPTSTAVTIQQPTSTPFPTEAAVFPPPPTVTRIDNAATDAAHLEQIFSGGEGYITLSPKIADMLLTDAQGRRLGYDPISRKDVNEFFDNETNYSTYTRYEGTAEDLSDTIILLPLQAWGSIITITLTGVEGGEYTLFTQFFDSNHPDAIPMYVYTGTIRPGEIVTETIKVPKKP
jgi:hypothetical protein